MNVRDALVAVLCACFANQASAAVEVVCDFPSRSTIEGTIRLEGPEYRLRRDVTGLMLEVEWTAGSWDYGGHLIELPGHGFAVFVGLPSTSPGLSEMVQVLTIHPGGNASLLTHHGDWGNTSQKKLAWLLQGRCEAPGTAP